MTVVSFETSGIATHVQNAQVDFPKRITYALARIAGRVGPLQNVSRDGRALLAEIIRCASESSPSLPIRLSNAHLASCLEMSVRSVCRLKAELEEGGWITRTQSQSRKYGMQILDISLTSTCIQSLGLSQTIKKREIHLTHDLESLTLLGLSKAAIVLLLAQAKRKSLELHTFVMGFITRVSAAKNPYAYISKAIDNYRHKTSEPLNESMPSKRSTEPKSIFHYMKVNTYYSPSSMSGVRFYLCDITKCIYQVRQDNSRHVFLDHRKLIDSILDGKLTVV